MRHVRTWKSLLLAPVAAGLFLASAACTSSDDVGSTLVVTCVVTPGNPWGGDSQTLLVRAVVTRGGAPLSGALVTFTSPTGGALNTSMQTGPDGFAEIDAVPPLADSSITITATAQPADGSTSASSTCTFDPENPWSIGAAVTGGTTDVDFACSLPIIDVEVAVEERGSVPGTVTDQAELRAIRIDWTLASGGGVPGETVPTGRTVSLSGFEETVPASFAVDGLVLLDDAARTRRPYTDVQCGEELDLVAVLETRVGSSEADGFVSSVSAVPVTLRRDCVPCP